MVLGRRVSGLMIEEEHEIRNRIHVHDRALLGVLKRAPRSVGDILRERIQILVHDPKILNEPIGCSDREPFHTPAEMCLYLLVGGPDHPSINNTSVKGTSKGADALSSAKCCCTAHAMIQPYGHKRNHPNERTGDKKPSRGDQPDEQEHTANYEK
ncbi:hypothetical protein BH24GEM2_BH24GEM2_09730 [soil metagenome]